METKEWLTTAQACEYLGISRETLRKVRQDPRNRIKFAQVGGRKILFYHPSLQRYLNKRAVHR